MLHRVQKYMALKSRKVCSLLKGKSNMKFKTRLRVTFISIILLPLLLTIMAFVMIAIYLMNYSQGLSLTDIDYSMMSENFREFTNTTDQAYYVLLDQVKEDSSRLEDKEYLDHINEEVSRKSTYIIVRKGDKLYYAGNEEAAQQIFEKLPAYGDENLSDDSGYFYNELEKYVKQIDFTFRDGTPGSVFIVTKVNSLISRHLLIDMFVAIIVILIFTSLMLTQWIHKGVFEPINELNVAMRKIKEGNFDYVLETDAKGEIGDLYRNYEDMRLRLKESTEENIQHEKQNKELVSNISHDLKTPITAVKGYVEGIMDGVADTPEKMDRYIRTIYNKANEMDRLINELTFYSKIDTNRIPYTFNKIHISDYFEDCVDELSVELESSGVSLTYFNYLEEDAVVIADAEQLKRVINNIVSNSLKYMDKPKGVINIRLRDVGDFIQIEIEDNGKGIAQKDLANIFERFYRTDASRNSSKGGSGIGLSIVKKIMEDHGGQVWATSKEGTGTTMYLALRKYQEVPVHE